MAKKLMEQYWEIKNEYEDEILLFRLGDFYEAFAEDARIVSRELEITLTSRFEGEDEVAMAGVPVQKSQSYVKKLLDNGHRIAMCEQTQDSSEASGLVNRDVVRVLTPGTLTEEEFLSENENNFLLSLHLEAVEAGLAWTDLSTGTFWKLTVPIDSAMDEIARVQPAECVLSESVYQEQEDLLDEIEDMAGSFVTPVPDWTFEEDTAMDVLREHFGTSSLEGFGIRSADPGVQAAGALLNYLEDTQKGKLDHIQKIRTFQRDRTMILDRISQRSLELTETIRTGETEGSLIHVLDHTTTAMGGRMLRRWVLSPLTNPEKIRQRQEGVEYLINNYEQRSNLTEILDQVYDIERVTSRLGSSRANPRDLLSLRQSLQQLPEIFDWLSEVDVPYFQELSDMIDALPSFREHLEEALVENPPRVISDGGIFQDGYDEKLDELREMRDSGKNWMASFQEQEINNTGIDSLKVGHNKVFGYYIEVNNSQKDNVPDHYIRKQTLKNSERYITPELKEQETKLLNAEDEAKELEYNLFLDLRSEAAEHIESLQKTSRAISRLDVLCCLAEVAEEKNWERPKISEEGTLNIREGRHPVVEELQEDRFVPNHTDLHTDENRLLVITGPNMAGKSTYIRQVGLLSILAQIGSFIPASRAEIGVVDRIFTRVGASDELSRGASTFMVEMTETANILNNATSDSLIILDEVGRGTSTNDGISIARSVCEYIHDRVGSRTLFATHYHELATLEDELPGVKNYHFSVKETGDDFVFLRKLRPGPTDRSYGIQVADLAGIPEEVISRAEKIMENLRESRKNLSERKDHLSEAAETAQLSLFANPEFQEKAKIAEKIQERFSDIDLETTTPIEALQHLETLLNILNEENGHQ